MDIINKLSESEVNAIIAGLYSIVKEHIDLSDQEHVLLDTIGSRCSAVAGPCTYDLIQSAAKKLL